MARTHALRLACELLEPRHLLTSISLDLGPQFQARQPGWTTLSGVSSSAAVVAPLSSTNQPTVTVGGNGATWFDASNAHTVSNPLNLAYRDGIHSTGTLEIWFTNLGQGTYTVRLASVDYTVAGTSAAPNAATWSLSVTDRTRANATVVTGAATSTRFNVASLTPVSVGISPTSGGTAVLYVTRTSGTVAINTITIDDGINVADVTAPSGSLTFSTAPTPIRAGVPAVSMAASSFTDTSGVQYYFENVDQPARNSGWVDVSSWTDYGSSAGATERYRFRVRDNSTAQNTTAWSAASSAVTYVDNTFGGFTSTEIGTRRPTFDFTGMRSVPSAPATGVHPRIFTSPEELPELRNRLATTQAGQETLALIAAYTRVLTQGSATYSRSAPYAVDAWGTARLNNVGYYDTSTFYNALVNYDWNASPAPANPLPFKTDGTVDADTRNKLASLITLAAYECWIFRGQPEYDARARDISKALDTWARLTNNEPGFTAGNDDYNGGVHFAEAYDFNYDMMTDAQRASVRTGIIKATWTPAMNYGFDNVPHSTTSNWAVLNDFVPVMLMAVEGEPGAYDSSYFRNFVRTQYNFITYGWYDTGAPNEGLGKNYQGLSTMAAFARRGYPLIGHQNVRAFITNYLPTITQPYGRSFSEYDDWGGSGRVTTTGGYKFASEDAVGAKWLFPTNSTADYVLQNYMALNGNSNPYATYMWANPIGQKPFAPQGYINNVLTASLMVSDYNTANLTGSAYTQATQNALKNKLSFFEPNRGLVNTRSDYSANALSLNFSSRQDLGGHTHADRNNFNLSALGRLWALYRTDSSVTGPSGKDLSMTEFTSNILIDGIGQGSSGTLVSKMPGKIVSYYDAPDATFSAGDAKYAYDWNWTTQLWSNAPIGPSTIPVGETLNQFRMTPSSESFYNEALYDRAFWGGKGYKENFTKTLYNPVRMAFRTTATVRGTNPYALVLDDYQKDATAHNYKWLMQLADDLSIESTVVSTANLANYRNDVILAEPGGDRRLLVRVIQANGLVDAAAPARVDTYFDPRYEKTPWKRLVIESNSVAPQFKVMLYPFRVGDTLPVTSLSASKFTNTIGTQVDEIRYSTTAADGRTRYSLVRSGVTVAAETPDVTPAAPTGLTAKATSQTRVVLQWSDNSNNEQLFRIERSTDGTTWQALDTTLGNVTTYLDQNLSPDTQYFYRVRAENALTSAFSAAASTRTYASGSINVTTGLTNYTQNFDTLISSVVQNVNYGGDAWLPGWSVARSENQQQFRYDDGNQTFPRPFSLGAAGTNDPTDRALGGLVPSATGSWQSQGALFRNITGQAVTRIDLSYAVEQWRLNTNLGTVKLYYKLQSTSSSFDLGTNVASWTAVPTLDFTSRAGTAGAVDGNSAANRATRNTSLNLRVPAGQYVWIGWTIAGKSNSNPTLAVDDVAVTFVPDAPAKVKNVWVSGSTWGSSFFNAVGSNFGYALPSGASQLTSLPWANLNRVSVGFNEPVTVTSSDLVLRGVRVPTYAISGFTYDPTQNVATWTLASVISADNLRVDLGGSITDSAGNRLDGEWTDGSSTFAAGSGDGSEGGPFRFRLNVLPADVLSNGIVLSNDVLTVRNRQGSSIGGATYSIFSDLDGNGVILASDVLTARNRQGTSLPVEEPL